MTSTANPKLPAAAKTQVLIVGGSLNGLTMALLLANFGVRCVVVERHSETARQYKFAGISPRSMEIYRSTGIEDEIRAKRTGDQKSGEIVRGKNLADPDIKFMGQSLGRYGGPEPGERRDVRPGTAGADLAGARRAPVRRCALQYRIHWFRAGRS